MKVIYFLAMVCHANVWDLFERKKGLFCILTFFGFACIGRCPAYIIVR